MPDTSEGSSTTSRQPASATPTLLGRLRALVTRRGVSSIRADLADALAGDPADARDFLPEERAMLRNILELRGLRVEDVMVPRADIVAVASGVSLADLLTVFRTAEHSRLPVYGETLDEPLGIVHIKDVLGHITARAAAGNGRRRNNDGIDLARVDLGQTLATLKILRPVLYVPPSMTAIDLLAQMQATRKHLALVIDEYGGTDGLVTIEDLVEMVVGDIEDEHDEDDVPMIKQAGDDSFVADARIPLDELAEAIGIDLSAAEAAEDVDTLGGLLFTLAGRVPVRGEIVAGPQDLEFEVLDADPRRVKRVKLSRRKPAARPARAARKAAEPMPGPVPEVAVEPAEALPDLAPPPGQDGGR